MLLVTKFGSKLSIVSVQRLDRAPGRLLNRPEAAPLLRCIRVQHVGQARVDLHEREGRQVTAYDHGRRRKQNTSDVGDLRATALTPPGELKAAFTKRVNVIRCRDGGPSELAKKKQLRRPPLRPD